MFVSQQVGFVVFFDKRLFELGTGQAHLVEKTMKTQVPTSAKGSSSSESSSPAIHDLFDSLIESCRVCGFCPGPILVWIKNCRPFNKNSGLTRSRCLVAKHVVVFILILTELCLVLQFLERRLGGRATGDCRWWCNGCRKTRV